MAQSWQAAALFTPGCDALTVYELAAAQSLLLSLLQMACTVQVLEHARKRNWVSLAGVYALRLGFSAASLNNSSEDSQDACLASIPVQAVVVLALLVWTGYLVRFTQALPTYRMHFMPGIFLLQVLSPTYSGLVAAQSWARNESARRQQAAAQQEWRDARQTGSSRPTHNQGEHGAEMVQRR